MAKLFLRQHQRAMIPQFRAYQIAVEKPSINESADPSRASLVSSQDDDHLGADLASDAFEIMNLAGPEFSDDSKELIDMIVERF